MKKILIFILILGLLFALTGCSKRIALDNGQTVKVKENFYIIKSLSHHVKLCYDPETKVMYYMCTGAYNFDVSPYYLSNGVVGIYGVNYK